MNNDELQQAIKILHHCINELNDAIAHPDFQDPHNESNIDEMMLQKETLTDAVGILSSYITIPLHWDKPLQVDWDNSTNDIPF
jgi:hypothetical protein